MPFVLDIGSPLRQNQVIPNITEAQAMTQEAREMTNDEFAWLFNSLSPEQRKILAAEYVGITQYQEGTVRTVTMNKDGSATVHFVH